MEKKRFHDVREYLDNIPNINRGGCGVAALAMYKWLNKNTKKKNVKIYFIHSCRDRSYEQNQEYLTGNEARPAGADHVVIKIGKNFYDSGGKIEPGYLFSRWGEYLLEGNEEMLEAAIQDPNNWNSYFNRTYIKQIGQTLGVKVG